MQKTKDTFLNHLITRLGALDSSRIVTIDGVSRPAVFACENERPELADAFENAFAIEWQECGIVGSRAGARTMTCAISYWTTGSTEMSGVDRGRELTKMDGLLSAMLAERTTPKLDSTMSPAAELGSSVFWGGLKFEAAVQNGTRLLHKAKLDVHYFAEESQ